MIEIVADVGATWKADTERESWERMCDLLDVVSKAGATIGKIQVLRRAMYGDGTKASSLVSEYEIPDEWIPQIASECSKRDLEFMATAYRAEDVPLIDPHVLRHKIASFDVGNDALLKAVIATGKPIIVSLGLGQMRCIAFRDARERTTALHCVSAYPTPHDQLNMARMRYLTGNAGFSDHSTGSTAAVMAVALGAEIIEKHVRHWLTPTTNPDYAAAASPDDFRAYVQAIREAERMMGDGIHRVQPSEMVSYQYDPTTGRRGGD